MKTSNEFFSTILQAGVTAHQLHLSTRSFADHKALEELYKGLPDHADELIESWQGANGKQVEYPEPERLPTASPQDFVQALSEFIHDNRKSAGEQTEIQNLIDELAGLVDQTLYRLIFLA